MGLCDLVGTTAAGWMSDRWDSRYPLGAYYGLRGLSLLFLPFALAGAEASLIIFAVAACKRERRRKECQPPIPRDERARRPDVMHHERDASVPSPHYVGCTRSR